MDYRVILSLTARRDIEDIVRYISFDAPQRALTFGRLLIAKSKLLGQFPEMGRIVPELGNSAIREIVVRSYRIVYRINHAYKQIEIIRFWHGRRGKINFNI